MSAAPESPKISSSVPQSGAVARALVRGAGIYAVANFAIRGINLLLVPVYTRYLTPADYGIIYLAETVATVLAIVASLGLSGAMRRLYFQHVDNAAALGRYVSGVLWAALLSGIAFAAAALVLGPPLLRAVAPGFKIPFYPFIAMAVGSALIARALELPMSLYQTENRPGAYTKMAVGFAVLTAAAALWQVAVVHAGAEGMLRGKLLAAAVMLGVTIVVLLPRLSYRPDWYGVRETLPLALPLVAHEFMALGLIAADRLIMERYRSLGEIGLYSLAYTFGMVMFLVTNSLLSAWSPTFFDLARREESRGMVARITVGVITVLAAIAVFGALIAQDFVERLLDSRYHAAGRVVPIVIAAYLLHALFSIFQLSALQAKKSWLLWISSATALVLNIALNFWWIPRWGMYGAAYATLAAYAVEALLMYVGAQKVFTLAFPIVRIILTLAMVAGSVAITQMHWATWRPVVLLATFACVALGLWLLGGKDLVEARKVLRPSPAIPPAL